MCKHFLTRDDAPAVRFEDGIAIFPTIPSIQPDQVVSQTNKILIYQEFPSFGRLLRNASLFPEVARNCFDSISCRFSDSTVSIRFTLMGISLMKIGVLLLTNSTLIPIAAF